MDWVFATFGVGAALDTTQPISELPVRYATEAGERHALPG